MLASSCFLRRFIAISALFLCFSAGANAQKIFKIISYTGKVDIKKPGKKTFEEIKGYTFIQADDMIKLADKAVIYLVRDDQKVLKIITPGQYTIAKLNKNINQYEIPQYSKSVGKYYWDRLVHGHKDLKDYPQKSLYVKGGVYRGNGCQLPFDSLTILNDGIKLGCAGNYTISFYNADNTDFPLITIRAWDSVQLLPNLSSVFKPGEYYKLSMNKDNENGAAQNLKTFKIATKTQQKAIDEEIEKLNGDKDITTDFRLVLMAEVYERNHIYPKAEMLYKKAIAEAKEYGCFAKEMYALYLQRLGNESGANTVMQSRTCGM